jgi:hypothetical protein
VLSGVIGAIKWGHYTAAAIHGYTVSPTDKTMTAWTLTATVVLADAFKMAQTNPPLVFVAKHAKGEWCWPIKTLARSETSLTATLGPPLALKK